MKGTAGGEPVGIADIILLVRRFVSLERAADLRGKALDRGLRVCQLRRVEAMDAGGAELGVFGIHGRVRGEPIADVTDAQRHEQRLELRIVRPIYPEV